LRVEPPLLDRPQVPGLLLGDQQRIRDAFAELGEDVARAFVVEDREHRVESEPVDAVVVDPELRVLDRPLAHRRLRVVDRVAPRGLVPVREVGAERGQRL
jgi:hypothetical protein